MHKHLCGKCEAILYECDWCDEKADHKIAGLCPDCQRKAGKFWTIEYAPSYGISIQMAEYDTDERWSETHAPYAMVSNGSEIKLRELRYFDMPDRPSDGSFCGCNNMVWILSDQEKDRLIALNGQRATSKVEKEKADRRAAAQRLVDAASKYTHPLMTDAEYKVWRKQYNDLYNEGGEGYIPDLITVEQLKRAKKILEE